MKAWELFYKNVTHNRFVCARNRIVLAVSGGMDSMCMLHMFWRLKKKINIDLLSVNFNHNLRKESKKEALIVKNFSEKLNIDCILESIDVEGYSKSNNVSIETAGRDLRYASLHKIAEKYNFNKISTAHNANDNAETVLMWLLRGSGNFSGIPQERGLSKNVVIIRPLLPIKRDFIEHYVKKHQLPFCTDSSNFTDIYTRNKIRHSLIPACEKINSMAVEHIFSLSCIQTRENHYLNIVSAKFLKKCVKFRKNQILLDLTMFLRYNEAIRFRILRDILPQKKDNNLCINLIMYKILSLDKSVYRLSADWVFKIKETNAYFLKGF
ncbi:MAG: tRNA lysidine(34) synthetase TilS [Endomicrobium sp.]|jgi:tRNA(Ile)-lysidine synthase|uniref:tRNA lysidine(34) synthetase TilS n=1 Tax=Candidatus Endomicrobiellum cubanum TaxID=3242325 RepID=UPI00282D5910|nr:tRNA lysidine(34) synthetase TilS [Endomicrobium sp.]